MGRFNIIHRGVLEGLTKILTSYIEKLESGTSYPGTKVLSTSMPYNVIL
jgi:hypothetical protein